MLPSVSVIIPNFNRENLIGETITNLLEQTLRPTEIIVVDDGSTDGSLKVIESFGACVRLICQSHLGPGAARNSGIKAATSEFIQFQDSDDLFSRNKLQSQISVLEKTNADIAFSPWAKVWIEKGVVRFENHVLQQRLPAASLPLLNWWLRGWSTVFQTVLFRRSFLSQVGMYRTDLMPTEDIEFFFRILAKQPVVAFTDECLTLYRLHSHNKISQDEGVPRDQRIIDRAKYFSCVLQYLREKQLKIDLGTKLRFWASVYDHLKYLEALNEPSLRIHQELEAATPAWLNSALEFILMVRRISAHTRQRLKGARWIQSYYSSPPSDRQFELVRELGFRV